MKRSGLMLAGIPVLMAGMIIGAFGRGALVGRLSANPAENSQEKLSKEVASRDATVFALSDRMSKVARLISPSVVHIQSERNTRRGLVEETGSGVIVFSDKKQAPYIVTNRHVVDGTELDRIDVHLHDGRVVHPQWIRTDKHTDLAVMAIDLKGLRTAKWGDSRRCEIGNIVLAVGSPFGLSQSITYGIISAKGRRALELGPNTEVINQDFLQTDAAINPGNSGGPLINLMGEVVGINTAIASNSGGNEGIGFSIPCNLVRQVMEQLLEYGKVQRAYLGVKLDNNFNSATATRLKMERVRGARVVEVYVNTPAAKAGVQMDDVIVKFNGDEVMDENHLINLVSLAPMGQKLETEVIRNGGAVTLYVVLGDREEHQQRAAAPADPSKGVPFDKLGITVHQIDPELAKQLGFPANSTGLLVLKVEGSSPMGTKLQRYDLIEEVARAPVNSVSDLQLILEERSKETLTFKVRRKSGTEIQSHIFVMK
ncbi:MAG: trypsin-like peptidase domain-containing protein [Planctomycetales bacterium]